MTGADTEKARPILLVLIFLVFCGACTGDNASTELPTRALAASTPLSTAVELESTPSTVPSATSRPTATSTATSTATLTPIPSATPCRSSGSVNTGKYPSSLAGAELAYRIYLPPCYREEGPAYPVLYLFSGNVHNESKWDELGIDEAADAAILDGTITPLLIVMPAGGWIANNTSGGPGSFESVVLEDLIPFVETTYCAWRESAGRAIGGLSRGGYWALEIAFRFPAQFASVGGHSAALLDLYAGPAINPRFTGLTNDLGTLRIYLDIGADDYLIANTRQLHEDLAEAGKPHTWRLNEGRHEDAYWAAHLKEYLLWYDESWPADRASYPLCQP